MRCKLLALLMLGCCCAEVGAICLPEESARVEKMMAEAEQPYEIYFTELCARNYCGIQAPLQWCATYEDGSHDQFDSTEDYARTRSLALRDIMLDVTTTAEQKAVAYAQLLVEHPELAEEWMENLLLEYYLADKGGSGLLSPIQHNRAELLRMAEQVFCTPGINWDTVGGNQLTPAGILFRFVMAAPACEPIADLFCRYAVFDETNALRDYPAIALAVMADCPQAVRLLLARGHVSPQLAVHCVKGMFDSHGCQKSAQNIAFDYCSRFYRSNNINYTNRLNLQTPTTLRAKVHGQEILKLLLPLLPQEVWSAHPAAPVAGDFTVQPAYPALQKMCPALLHPLVCRKAPQTDAAADEAELAEPEDEADFAGDDEPLPDGEHLPACTDADAECAVACIRNLLQAEAVDSVYTAVPDANNERMQLELQKMYDAAYKLYGYVVCRKALPVCIQQEDGMFAVLADVAAADDAPGGGDTRADACDFACDACSELEEKWVEKWQSLLRAQTRLVDIAVPLQLQGHETEVRISVSAANPRHVLGVQYAGAAGQGGKAAWAPVLRFVQWVPVGASAVATIDADLAHPVIICGDPSSFADAGRWVVPLPNVVAHLGKHVRCVGYKDDYGRDVWPLILYTEAFAPDGTVAEGAEGSELPTRPVRVIVELIP